MRIGMVVTPFNADNIQLASQIGVTDLVVRYSGSRVEEIEPLCRQAERHGLKISVVEGYLPMDHVVLGGDNRRDQLETLKELIRSMEALNIGVLCYNWMGLTDWTRTSFEVPGGVVLYVASSMHGKRRH